MTIKELIGFQLVSITDKRILVRKDDALWLLQIAEYEGDCCGFNEIEARLLVDDADTSRNPVITDVNVVKSNDGWNEGERCEVTFFGECKPLATLNTYSGSGSGWQYGACVRLICKPLELDETLSSW